MLVPDDQVAGYADDLGEIEAGVGMPSAEEINWKPAKNSFLATAGGEIVSTLRQRMPTSAS